MAYLSPQIEALLKLKNEKNLVTNSTSCGIFQDCGLINSSQNNYSIKNKWKKEFY